MSGKVLKSRKKRGLTPVISTIILSAVVIAVVGAIWAYSQGAATVFASNYINETFNMLDELIERFCVKHVSNNSGGVTLYVWVFNYGDVDIEVDVYVNATHFFNSSYSEYTFKSSMGTSIISGSFKKIEISFSGSPLQLGDQVSVKVHSRRQNNAFYTYYAS